MLSARAPLSFTEQLKPYNLSAASLAHLIKRLGDLDALPRYVRTIRGAMHACMHASTSAGRSGPYDGGFGIPSTHRPM